MIFKKIQFYYISAASFAGCRKNSRKIKKKRAQEAPGARNMSRSLVIVESPSKAKTINRYLGSEYEVMASVGHIRDLPQAGSAEREKTKRMTPAELRKLSPEEKARLREEREHGNLVRRMGIDPDNGWKADYRILPGKEKVVRELKAAAAKSDAVYLATDLDREGEAIAWHLREVLGGGTFFNLEIPGVSDFTIGVLLFAPGGFFVFGCLIALVNRLTKGKGVKKQEFGCEGCPSASACALRNPSAEKEEN